MWSNEATFLHSSCQLLWLWCIQNVQDECERLTHGCFGLLDNFVVAIEWLSKSIISYYAPCFIISFKSCQSLCFTLYISNQMSSCLVLRIIIAVNYSKQIGVLRVLLNFILDHDSHGLYPNNIRARSTVHTSISHVLFFHAPRLVSRNWYF